MNENRKAGEQCYRIIRYHETGPKDDPACRLTPDGAALDAYQCSANKWTIGLGCTRHPDGTKVRQGDTIEPHEVELYLAKALERVEADLRRTVKRELNQHQWDAMTSWVYNLGIGNLIESSEFLPALNAGRWTDAASDFTKWIYATTGKDGKPWKRALRGLLIRRLQESCVFMGYDFEPAVQDEGVALPVSTVFQPDWKNPDTGELGRWFDKTLPGKTMFADILRTAEKHPLSKSIQDTPAAPASPVASAGTQGPEKPPSPTTPASPASHVKEPAKTEHDAADVSKIPPVLNTIPAAPVPQSPSATGPAVVEPKAAPSVSPPPVVKPPVVAPPLPKDAAPNSNEPKDMLLSKRFYGLAITAVGTTQFLPRGVTDFINNEGNRELLSWLIVVIAGVILYQYGKYKARKPLK